MKRDPIVDILRATAILLIILAHTNCPTWLTEFRGFDVVLCVILSGISFRYSSTIGKKISYIAYLKKRIKKLLLPTWGILLLIFGFSMVINRSFEPFGVVKMIESFLLYDGIGYVWFVRVTLILAVSTPLVTGLYRFAERKRCHLLVLLVWASIYYAVLALYNAVILNVYINYYFIYLFLIYFLGYGIVYYFGYAYQSFQISGKISLTLIGSVLLTVGFFMGVTVSGDKYPPGALYLSYGVLWFVVLYEILKHAGVRLCSRATQYISENSFTIYLLHIIPLLLIKYCGRIAMFTDISFVIEYMFIIACTAFLLKVRTLIIKKVVTPVVQKRG